MLARCGLARDSCGVGSVQVEAGRWRSCVWPQPRAIHGGGDAKPCVRGVCRCPATASAMIFQEPGEGKAGACPGAPMGRRREARGLGEVAAPLRGPDDGAPVAALHGHGGDGHHQAAEPRLNREVVALGSEVRAGVVTARLRRPRVTRCCHVVQAKRCRVLPRAIVCGAGQRCAREPRLRGLDSSAR